MEGHEVLEITTSGNDDVSASIQQQGIRFSPDGQIRGNDLGHYGYIFSLADITSQGGRLTVEIYRFQSRGKIGEPISEYINSLDFQFGSPVCIEASADGFSADLALSISSR